jgi:Ca2+-transporting ATPase
MRRRRHTAGADAGKVLWNDARLAYYGGDAHMGDPTEIALLLAARRYGLERSALEEVAPRVGEVPFDSATKWMSTQHRLPAGDSPTVTKGAPEALLGNGLLVQGP